MMIFNVKKRRVVSAPQLRSVLWKADILYILVDAISSSALFSISLLYFLEYTRYGKHQGQKAL